MARTWSIVSVGLVASAACSASHSAGSAVDAAQNADAASADAGMRGPTCGSDADCGPHMYCDIADDPPAPSCACVAGYALGGGSACAWVGVVANPGFDQSTGWTIQGNVPIAIETAYAGSGVGSDMIDPGALVLSATDNGLNDGDDTVDQLLFMPRASRAQPLVLEIDGAYTIFNSDPNSDGSVVVGLGDGWPEQLPYVFRPGDSWTHERYCLGGAEYAPESSTGSGAVAYLTLEAAAATEPGGSSELYLDRVDIVPADDGECPDAGTVQNGDAEGSGGWTFITEYGGSAGFVDGVGQNGTRGVELVSGSCEGPQANVAMSTPVPTATESAMLSIYHRSAGGGPSLGLFAFGSLPASPDGSGTVDNYCLPAQTLGLTTQVVAALSGCSPSWAVIDNVEVANDPRCAYDNGVVDGSFESGLPPVAFPNGLNYGVAVVAGSDAADGDHYLAMTTVDGGASSNWTFEYTTPVLAPGMWLAMTFQYRTTGTTVLSDPYTPQLASPSWTEGAICLGYAPPGSPGSIDFYAECGSAGACSGEVDLDSFALTTVHSCADLPVASVTRSPAAAPARAAPPPARARSARRLRAPRP